MADPIKNNEVMRRCTITLNSSTNGALPQIFEGFVYTSNVNRLSDILNDNRKFIPIMFNNAIHLVNKNVIETVKQH